MSATLPHDDIASQPSARPRVLIVDDHPVVRKGLRIVLEETDCFSVCGEAGNLSDALRQYQETGPDVVIADVSLGTESGLDLVRELISLNSRLPILMCSMHEDTLFAERALRAGAKGYIRKDESTDRLLLAVRRVVDGRIYLSDRMTERMLHRQVGGEPAPRFAVESLSDRELQVFQQIGQGMPTRQIAEKLQLSPKTVETHREKIKAKLNLANASELTQHAVLWVMTNS